MTRFGSNRDGSYKPYFGWIGWKPNLYFDSERTPGAVQHLDPDPVGGLPAGGHRRPRVHQHPVAGRRRHRRHRAARPDRPLGLAGRQHDPRGRQRGARVHAQRRRPVRHDDLPAHGVRGRVPQGRGQAAGRHDGPHLHRVVARPARARRTGTAATTTARLVKDGKYDMVVTPRDGAGNVGESADHVGQAAHRHEGPQGAAQPVRPDRWRSRWRRTTTLSVTLTQEATITWRIVNAAGDVVRRGMTDAVLPAGPAELGLGRSRR